MDPGEAPKTPPAPSRAGGWRPFVGALAAMFLGAVFLVAVWGKMFDVKAFAEAVTAEGLGRLWPHPEAIAYVALALEAVIGFALVMNLRYLWLLVPAAGLILFFLVLTGRTYVQYLHGINPEVASCGCFGSLVERTPTEAFWQDLALLVPPLALCFLGRPRGPFPWRRATLVAVLAAGVVVFAWKALDLPLDDLATHLHPGVRVEDVCAGSGQERICLTSPELAPGLAEGRHVVVIADIKDPSFAEMVGNRLDEFLAWASDPKHNPILVLHSGTKTDEGAFHMMSRGAPLELVAAPRPLLRRLYRKLPRTFVTQDGKVVRTYDGLPSLTELGR